MEKDFWVCWTLKRMASRPELAKHITFKGGTSLSKAYGIIQRFSEDIDLTIRRTAPGLDGLASPFDPDISGKERGRRTDAIKAGAQAFVLDIARPTFDSVIEASLGHREGWSIELDHDDGEQQTLLFHYPLTIASAGSGYIKPRIKLEFGARGDPEPFQARVIRPYLADEFPDAFSDPIASIETLAAERTYWEKATILHALHHNGKLRDGMSRHYYDLLMLDEAGITQSAIAQRDLLASVVRNKNLMFSDRSASYDTAVLSTLRLLPSDGMLERLRADYLAMADMFIVSPPKFEQLLERLSALEAHLNAHPAP
jgi:hypothetical protein